ncbi:MAG: hypothetical protein ABSG93_17050 [Solirubrobacteraceae bacterium]
MLTQLSRVMRSIATAAFLLLAVAVSSALAAHALDPATAHAASRSHTAKHKKAHKRNHKKKALRRDVQADIATSTSLLGVTSVEANHDTLVAGQAEVFRLQADSSGVAGVAHLYISAGNAAKSVVVGIYSSVGAQPGSLLGVGSASAATAGTWSTVPITHVGLVAGTTYWLAILGTGGTLDYRDRASGSCPAETSAQANLGTLPSSWKAERGYWTCPASAYVTVAEPPPVEPPPVEPPPPAPPVNTAAPTIAGNAIQGQTLSTSVGAWSGAPTSYAYQWADCDALGEGCWNVAGATASSYTLTAADLGSTVRAVVTASNAGGATAASSVATATVLAPPPAAPVNIAPPTVSGSVVEGQTLSAGTGTWSGSPTSYAYQWQDCNSSGAHCVEVSGAIASTYKLAATDVGDTVRAVVTASNAGGATAASSAATATVTTPPPVAPSNTALPSISGSAEEGQTLSASTGTWSGGPTSYAYQWERCNSSGEACVNASGATSATYKLSAVDVGHTLRVVVTASNVGGSTPASSTATATVEAPPPPGAPTNTALPAVSGSAVEGQTLSASTGTWSGSPTSYGYQWEDCNSSGEACANVSGATSATYKLSASDVGHTLRVVVTATNAGGSTKATASATGTVVPLAPSNTVLPAVSGTAEEGQTLSASTGTWSGSPTSYGYQWEDCNSSGEACASISGATSATYKVAASDVGHTLRVVVTATSAGGSTKATSAATATVVVDPPPVPVNTALPAISGTAEEGQTLSASTGTWSGSPTSYGYQWEDCNSSGEACANVSGATSATYKLAASDVGHTLRVVVTATNASGGTAQASVSTSVVSAAGVCTVTLTPSASASTIASDIASAANGSTVCLANGTYPSGITISKAAHTAYVTVRPAAGATATVPGIKIANSSYLRFEGLNMTAGFNAEDAAGTAGNHYQFVDNSISEAKYGIVLYGDAAPITEVLIERNYIHDITLPAESGGKCTQGYAEGQGVTLFYADGVTIKNNNFNLIYAHYIQGGGESKGVDVEHNLFMGHIAEACSHLNFWQIYEGSVNSTFKDNVMIGEGTGEKGGTSETAATVGLEFENGPESKHCSTTMENTAVENNLFVDAADSYAISTFVTKHDTTTHNTIVGSEYGTGFLTKLPEHPTETCGGLGVPAPFTEGTQMTHNIDVKNGASNDFTFEECEGGCTFNEDVSEDETAKKAFSKSTERVPAGASSYVAKWSPAWASTTWPVFKEVNEEGKHLPTMPAGFYEPTTAGVKALHAGYEGQIGIEPEAAKAPVNTALPVISGSATVGQTLSATSGSWEYAPASYSYQWRDCNTAGVECTSISGATGASYKLASVDGGYTVSVAVTATNPYGATAAASIPTGTVSEAGGGGEEPSLSEQDCFENPGEKGENTAKIEACGYPGYNNTGPEGGVALTEASGVVKLTGNEHYEDKRLKGQLKIEPGATGVVVKNDEIITEGTCPSPYNLTAGCTGGSVYLEEGAKSTIFSHDRVGGTELRGPNTVQDCFRGANQVAYTVEYTKVLFCGGFKIDGGGTLNHDYCPDNENIGYKEGGAAEDHYECLSSEGNSSKAPLVIENSTFLNPHEGQTAAIYLESLVGPIHEVTIEKDFLAGGGYVIYGGSQGGETPAGPEKIVDNRIARCVTKGSCPDAGGYYERGGEHGVEAYVLAGATVSGNFWDNNLEVFS